MPGVVPSLGDPIGGCSIMVPGGVEFIRPPNAEPWGTYARFKDADGDRLVLSGR